MKRTKLLFSVLSLQILFLIGVYAQQDEEKGSLNSGTLESQFEYLYQKSGRYQDYRVIKINELLKFRNNIYDTLKVNREKLRAERSLVAGQKNTIDSLNVKLQNTNKNLADVTEEKDSIKFLGMPMSKTGYNTLLWSIIAALAVLLAVFIGKFKQSNAITVQARNDKAEIEEEYESHRQRSLEREQKLRRELQDEINKQKYGKQDPKKGN